jgi:hypothetical protein
VAEEIQITKQCSILKKVITLQNVCEEVFILVSIPLQKLLLQDDARNSVFLIASFKLKSTYKQVGKVTGSFVLIHKVSGIPFKHTRSSYKKNNVNVYHTDARFASEKFSVPMRLTNVNAFL